jgi:hypothetical protein
VEAPVQQAASSPDLSRTSVLEKMPRPENVSHLEDVPTPEDIPLPEDASTDPDLPDDETWYECPSCNQDLPTRIKEDHLLKCEKWAKELLNKRRSSPIGGSGYLTIPDQDLAKVQERDGNSSTPPSKRVSRAGSVK